jgi:hypothetical protein
MVVKINLLFILFILSLFLFANSLSNRELEALDVEDQESETEANNELKYGMAQDFDHESLAELQLDDFYTQISDRNSHFLDDPKERSENTNSGKNKY